MIISCYHSAIKDLAEMTDVTDEMIASLSEGDTGGCLPCDEDAPLDGTIDDVKLFGTPEEGKLAVTRIPLPYAVTNIRQLYGPGNVLARIPGCTRKMIDEISMYDRYVVTGPGTDAVPTGSTVTRDMFKCLGVEVDPFGNPERDDTYALLSGGVAVEWLLEYYDVPEREKAVLHSVPVVPISLRFVRRMPDGKGTACPYRYFPLDVENLYSRLLDEINAKIVSYDTGIFDSGVYDGTEELVDDGSQIFIKRSVQQAVNNLIDNGADGRPAVDSTGLPYDSLEETYERIVSTGPGKKEPFARPDGFLDGKTEQMLEIKAGYKDLEKKLHDTDAILKDSKHLSRTVSEIKVLEGEMRALMEPDLDKIVETYFRDYRKGFGKRLIKEAGTGIACGIGGMADTPEGFADDAFHTAWSWMDMFIRKRAAFAAAD